MMYPKALWAPGWRLSVNPVSEHLLMSTYKHPSVWKLLRPRAFSLAVQIVSLISLVFRNCSGRSPTSTPFVRSVTSHFEMETSSSGYVTPGSAVFSLSFDILRIPYVLGPNRCSVITMFTLCCFCNLSHMANTLPLRSENPYCARRLTLRPRIPDP